MNILDLRPRLYVRLYKVDETPHLWVFTFRDPVNRFMESVIVPKNAPWEKMEKLWEKVHEVFYNALFTARLN